MSPLHVNIKHRLKIVGGNLAAGDPTMVKLFSLSGATILIAGAASGINSATASACAADFDRERVVQAMVGRSLSATLHGVAEREPRPYGRKGLSVQNLSSGSMVRNTSFSFYAGQITGIFGLVGAGRTEMMKVVAGVLKRDLFYGGEVMLHGKSVRYRAPRQAVRDGVVYVTEDRKVEGFRNHVDRRKHSGRR